MLIRQSNWQRPRRYLAADGHHLAAPSTFAEMDAMTPEDWAEAKRIVRGRAEQEKAQRGAG